MNGFRDMEVYDMEQALRLFCDTSTRSFLYDVWGAYKRIDELSDQLNKASMGYAKRGDLISELNNSVQFLERMSEDRLKYIKELEEREGMLEDRIQELETAYDEVDWEYKATLEALESEQGLVSEQAEIISDLRRGVGQ